MTESLDYIRGQINLSGYGTPAPVEEPDDDDTEEDENDDPEEADDPENDDGEAQDAAPTSARAFVARVLNADAAAFERDMGMTQAAYLSWVCSLTARQWADIVGPGAEPVRESDLPDDLRAMLMRESLSERISEGARRYGWTTETLRRGRR